MDLVLERIEHARTLRPPITRRRLAAQRPPDRVLRQPRLAHQPLDRLAADEVLAPQLGPPLHSNHPFAAFPRRSRRRGSAPPRTPPPTAQGVKFRAAEGSQSSHGADSRAIHRLFDLGYMSARSDGRVLVSPRLKSEFANGDTYYALEDRAACPSRGCNGRALSGAPRVALRDRVSRVVGRRSRQPRRARVRLLV